MNVLKQCLGLMLLCCLPALGAQDFDAEDEVEQELQVEPGSNASDDQGAVVEQSELEESYEDEDDDDEDDYRM
jgi:hypothetical protein